ncbi:SDR family oxidoreductase [Methylocystis heyeri]|uniref:SDR family oxidoreductase n=1 Tax=Methylocystis heyeri TaxID=391905 RepID=A0A6B8KBU6_9HYPH|nr:SDR family oxidoreductase [Methylocystis heyeri]QGM45032.1 SDR family oxidoreductase [Methylocystis heyeri]
MIEAKGPVLVTGAARRIGLAIAHGLARAGRPVVIHASKRSLPEAQLAAQALEDLGARAAAIGADLSDAAETALLIEKAEEPFGPLTLLVNNASVFELDSADDFSLEVYERQMAVNLRAPLLLAQRFAKRLPAGVEGAIVNMIDQRVWRLTPRYFTYTLTKSALWTATRTMAQAFAPSIRVNAVGPGPVLPNAFFGEKGFEAEVAGVPLQRPTELSAVVDAVIYLANARNVTGQMIAVDSGQHLSWQTPDVLPE